MSAEHLEDKHDNARQRSDRRQNLGRWTKVEWVEWVEWERAHFWWPSMPSDWIAHRYAVGVNVPMTNLQLEVFLITADSHSVVETL